MRGEVKLPAFCTVRTLAQLTNVSAHMSRMLLRECGVRRMSAGRRVLIPMTEIEEKIPLLFESLQLVASVRRRREKGMWRS